MYVGVFGIEGREEEGGVTLLAAEGGQKKSTLAHTAPVGASGTKDGQSRAMDFLSQIVMH